jgi:hypothetical protein
MSNDLDINVLRELLIYDPETGIFRWRNQHGRMKANTIAGDSCKGGWRICVNYRRYMAHRLAYFYMKGVWPNGEIDHKDLDQLNNRFENLRVATHAQNAANTRAKRTNKLGVKGVFYNPACPHRPFQARINISRKHKYLGSYSSVEAASAAYEKAAIEAYGKFARAA